MSSLFGFLFEATVREPQSSDSDSVDYIPDFLGDRREHPEAKVSPRFNWSSSDTCHFVVRSDQLFELCISTLEGGFPTVRLHSSLHSILSLHSTALLLLRLRSATVELLSSA